MRKILAGFLTVLMLTPSLACAMPTCGPKAKEAAATSQPCADHHPGHESGSKKKTDKVNLLLDCMGVDMQKADTASIDKPDLKKTAFVTHALTADVLAYQVVNTDSGSIRGPPPDWLALSQTQPSILLTTQRFRI